MSAMNLSWERVRRLGHQLTTPLLPDDYLTLINPLWSSRELRGRIEKVVPETDDAATVVIRPGWGWRYDHQAGQYVGIGLDVDGKIHWRSYSLSSAPKRSGGTITITVRAMPEGFLSDHLVNGVEAGTIVRLASPQGDFVLPSPTPEKVLFLVAGSGITPVMSMLRTLDRRRDVTDVTVVYSSPTKDRMIFREELEAMQDKHPGFTLHEQLTDEMGMLGMDDLADVCPDYLERQTWACGPGAMLDAAEEHWEERDLEDRLHLERFNVDFGGSDAEGGTVTFQNSQKTIEADGATTILEAGEEKNIGMPYGCRMGICHTCTLTLVEGRVRDLRNGTEYTGPNEKIQTCVTAAAGDCTIGV